MCSRGTLDTGVKIWEVMGLLGEKTIEHGSHGPTKCQGINRGIVDKGSVI